MINIHHVGFIIIVIILTSNSIIIRSLKRNYNGTNWENSQSTERNWSKQSFDLRRASILLIVISFSLFIPICMICFLSRNPARLHLKSLELYEKQKEIRMTKIDTSDDYSLAKNSLPLYKNNIEQSRKTVIESNEIKRRRKSSKDSVKTYLILSSDDLMDSEEGIESSKLTQSKSESYKIDKLSKENSEKGEKSFKSDNKIIQIQSKGNIISGSSHQI